MSECYMSHLEDKKREIEADTMRLGRPPKTAKQEWRLEKALLKDWLDEGRPCAKCGRKENITVDHIVPKFYLKQLGMDEIFIEENLQPMCKWCNLLKANKLDFSDPRTKPLLLKFLEQVP